MNLTANDPRKSWLPVPSGSDFPIQNLPFGVFIPRMILLLPELELEIPPLI